MRLQITAYESQFDLIFILRTTIFSFLNRYALIRGLLLSSARPMWKRKTNRQHISSYLLQPLNDTSLLIIVHWLESDTKPYPNNRGGWEMKGSTWSIW